MERIPEPELMVEKEQVISYDEADFSEGEVNLINQINYYLLRKKISLGEKDLIVDLGCFHQLHSSFPFCQKKFSYCKI